MRFGVRGFLQYTFLVVLVFLVLTHAGGFASGIKSLSTAYAGGVRALEGR